MKSASIYLFILLFYLLFIVRVLNIPAGVLINN